MNKNKLISQTTIFKYFGIFLRRNILSMLRGKCCLLYPKTTALLCRKVSLCNLYILLRHCSCDFCATFTFLYKNVKSHSEETAILVFARVGSSTEEQLKELE